MNDTSEGLAKVGALDDRARRLYRESLKVYRDNYAIAQTECSTGIAMGREMQLINDIEVMCSVGISDVVIAEKLGVSLDYPESPGKDIDQKDV